MTILYIIYICVPVDNLIIIIVNLFRIICVRAILRNFFQMEKLTQLFHHEITNNLSWTRRTYWEIVLHPPPKKKKKLNKFIDNDKRIQKLVGNYNCNNILKELFPIIVSKYLNIYIERESFVTIYI